LKSPELSNPSNHEAARINPRRSKQHTPFAGTGKYGRATVEPSAFNEFSLYSFASSASFWKKRSPLSVQLQVAQSPSDAWASADEAKSV
jgi:hypothetical protein